jgi:hypothetical protein
LAARHTNCYESAASASAAAAHQGKRSLTAWEGGPAKQSLSEVCSIYVERLRSALPQRSLRLNLGCGTIRHGVPRVVHSARDSFQGKGGVGGICIIQHLQIREGGQGAGRHACWLAAVMSGVIV